MTTICELCFPHAVAIADIGDNILLFKNNDKYGLIGWGGHNIDIHFYFPNKPVPDPDSDELEGLTEEQTKAANQWLDDGEAINNLLKMDAWTGYIFVLSCMESGWNTERQKDCGYDGGLLSYWLLQFCGNKIQEWEQHQHRWSGAGYVCADCGAIKDTSTETKICEKNNA